MNALLLCSGDGGNRWATSAPLVKTVKLNSVDPHAWLANTLNRTAAGHPATGLGALTPWNHARAVG